MNGERRGQRPVDRADGESRDANDCADQGEVHAVAIQLRGDDVGEADHKWRRQVDAAKQHHQRLADRSDAEQRGQDEHRADREFAAVARDQDCADEMQDQRQCERGDDPLARRAESANHRAFQPLIMIVRPLSETEATRIMP